MSSTLSDSSRSQGGFYKALSLEVTLPLFASLLTLPKILQQPTASVWWHAIYQRVRCRQWEFLSAESGTNWHISLPPTLSRDRSYLVLANQQTRLDALLIQMILAEKITPIVQPVLQSRLPNLFQEWFAWLEEAPILHHISAERRANETDSQTSEWAQQSVAFRNIVEQKRSLLLLPEKGAYRDPSKVAPGRFAPLFPPKAGELVQATISQEVPWHAVLDVTLHHNLSLQTLFDLRELQNAHIFIDVREVNAPSGIQQSSANDLRKWLQSLWQEKAQRLENLLQEQKLTQNTNLQ